MARAVCVIWSMGRNAARARTTQDRRDDDGDDASGQQDADQLALSLVHLGEGRTHLDDPLHLVVDHKGCAVNPQLCPAGVHSTKVRPSLKQHVHRFFVQG